MKNVGINSFTDEKQEFRKYQIYERAFYLILVTSFLGRINCLECRTWDVIINVQKPFYGHCF